MENRPRYRLSVEQYDKMIEHGILTKYSKVELIRGEIVAKMPIGDLHSWCVIALNRLFGQIASAHAIVDVQGPIRLADSEPEPDIVLLSLRDDLYRSGKPKAGDELLIIEVADSSLEYDREVKGPLYAENGIPEYWILNVVDRCMEVYRGPQPDKTYGSVQSLRAGETITLSKLPSVSVAVSDIIP